VNPNLPLKTGNPKVHRCHAPRFGKTQPVQEGLPEPEAWCPCDRLLRDDLKESEWHETLWKIRAGSSGGPKRQKTLQTSWRALKEDGIPGGRHEPTLRAAILSQLSEERAADPEGEKLGDPF